MSNDFSSISSGETTLICCISLRSLILGKSQVPKSTALVGLLDSIFLPSGVSSGIFFVRPSALARRDFPVCSFSDFATTSGVFLLWIAASFRSSSSAFFLYTSSTFHFFIGTISSSSDGMTISRILRMLGTDSLTLLSIARYEIRSVR